MPKMLLVALLLCAVPVGVSQESKPLSEAGTATCDYPSGESVGKWVMSSASGYSATVEIRVSVTGSGDQRHCVTSWRLHIRGKGKNERVLTVDEREDNAGDDEWDQENSFEINGWSKDGQLLLTSQVEAQGDWDETTPIVFDFSTGRFWRVELNPLFKRVIPSGCFVVYRAIGFTADGAVLIAPFSTDNDGDPGTKPCFPASRWKLDFRKSTITRVEVKRKN
jgi:hypothetical protein